MDTSKAASSSCIAVDKQSYCVKAVVDLWEELVRTVGGRGGVGIPCKALRERKTFQNYLLNISLTLSLNSKLSLLELTTIATLLIYLLLKRLAALV